jgi:aspartate-semialdehyde dehydrogenase
MKVAVVGVTGMVGRKMLEILKERDFPVSELIPVASSRSLGKEIRFNGMSHIVIGLGEALKRSPDIALFSAGSNISRQWAPQFSEASCTVIDNSSAWRMEADIPLIIPEINPEKLSSSDRIIANPNCSTIQMLMALAPLHRAFGIKRIIVSTYQSVSGSGKKALNQLEQEKDGICTDMAYPHPIYNNCIPQCADFEENSYTTEEMKLVNETRKILDDTSINISATAVRVPVTGGHSESINVEFHKDFSMEKVRSLIDDFPGVCLQDDPATSLYPMPVNAYESDNVFVGRLRRDISNNKALNLWVVSDNIRKGAATNTVQIAELIISR